MLRSRRQEVALKTLYRASRVHTFTLQPPGEWMLVDDRHVERVGTGEPPPADDVVELPGATIMPGFVDAHVHLSGTGLALTGLDLSIAESRDRVLSLVAERAGQGRAPLFGQGMDESGWADPSLPVGPQIEEVAGQAPVLLVRTDGYVSVASRTFVERAGVGELPGVERDASGAPTGVLHGEANSRAQLWYFDTLPDADIHAAQARAAGLAASRGVTCVHEMSLPDKRGRRDGEILLANAADLAVEVITYFADRDIPYVMDLGLPRIGGDLFLDGSIGARTAALLETYAGGEASGNLTYDDDDLAEFLHNAHLAGLQTGLHVIGDGAIDQALRVWERVYRSLDSRERRHFRARRHRLEHFELASSGQVERAGALGMAISIQPAFDARWGHAGGMYEARLGETRARGMNPFRTLVDRGLEVGAGSDAPVTPIDPMLAVWALEHHHDPEQRFSRAEALRICTIGAARLAHLEKKGMLEPGASADFAAYDQDPTEVDDTRDLRPVLTVSRGRRVHAA